jgi:hypothetical protein
MFFRENKNKAMHIGKFLQRQKELLFGFRNGVDVTPDNSYFRIENYWSESEPVSSGETAKEGFLFRDKEINENCHFSYPVFIPNGVAGFNSGILLLHGLNERNWDKYLCWAEFLTVNTQKPVILFPIAFHINRGPSSWSNPKSMTSLVENRKSHGNNCRSLSFANAALSERLTEEPYRFFSSGKQTISDITRLAGQIMAGKHPVFQEGTCLDIFGYSIGSFLAEILLMANPGNLFSFSKLFVFCGGSIFSHMFGESRYIMDKTAYERLFQYYCNEWFHLAHKEAQNDEPETDLLLQAFTYMIRPEYYRDKRETIFSILKTRIAGISLLKDKVMPYSGVESCMGGKVAGECFELIDFPYEYTHESPFPATGRVDGQLIDASFLKVFRKCAAFFA